MAELRTAAADGNSRRRSPNVATVVDGRGERGPVVDVLDDARIETSEVVRRSRTGVGLVVLGALAAVGLGVVALRGGDEVATPVTEPSAADSDLADTTAPDAQPVDLAKGVDVFVTDQPWDWQPFELPDGVNDVHLDGEVVVAYDALGDRLWLHDGEWVERTLPPAARQITTPREGVIAATTDNGNLALTSDHGLAWRAVLLDPVVSSSELVGHVRLALDAVRHGDSVVVTIEEWPQFDADAYLELVGEELMGDEIAAVLDPSNRRIDLVTFSGMATRRIELDDSLLDAEAEAAIERMSSAPTTRILRVDPSNGGVLEEVAPPELRVPINEIEVVDGQLRFRLWNGDLFVRDASDWERVDDDEPTHGTIGGVDIDLLNGLLRLSADGERIDWPGTGLGFIQGVANDEGAVFVTEPPGFPSPAAVVDVPEGSIEFVLHCCVTLTTELGSRRYELREGPFPGEITETDSGWTISTDDVGDLTLSREAWEGVRTTWTSAIAELGGNDLLTTSTGTEWSLTPLRETLGSLPSFAMPQISAGRVMLTGRTGPDSPQDSFDGLSGRTLAWIAEIPG